MSVKISNFRQFCASAKALPGGGRFLLLFRKFRDHREHQYGDPWSALLSNFQNLLEKLKNHNIFTMPNKPYSSLHAFKIRSNLLYTGAQDRLNFKRDRARKVWFSRLARRLGRLPPRLELEDLQLFTMLIT